MYLSKVNIKNFRNLKDVTVNLRSGLNVLVGRNNAGKTNIFKAIRQAIGPVGARAESIWLERDDFYRASANAESESIMSITLTFSDLSEQQRAKFYEIVDFDLTDLPRSTAVIRFEASWPDGKRQARIKRTGGPASVEPPEVPTDILESLPITFLPALRDAESCLAPGYYHLAPSLLEKDVWGNWVIRKDYNPAMLAEAMCKHEGFSYVPSEEVYWQHGHSSETDFIYVTTQTLNRQQLTALSDEVGTKRTLLVCCSAFRVKPDAFPNLTLKKIPKTVLRNCEWDRDDYSLEVSALPAAPTEDEKQAESIAELPLFKEDVKK